MKRSYAILLAAIAALALVSTTCAVPMPDDKDPAQGVTAPEPDTRNFECKQEADAERVKCMSKLQAKALRQSTELPNDYAQGCQDDYVQEVGECDYDYPTGSS